MDTFFNKQLSFRNILVLLVFIAILVIFYYYIDWRSLFSNNDITDKSSQPNILGFRKDVNYLDGVDIIYWINLDRSTDRRKNMMILFQDDVFNNVPIERVTAVDGQVPKLVYQKLSITRKQKNDYEYACMVSHLDTIRKFSESTNRVALILEDDITLEFKKYWNKSIKEIMNNAPPDWEIIQLCYISVHSSPEKFQLYEPNLKNKCVSAAAFLMKNSAAKKLMQNTYYNGKYNLDPNLIHHADCYMFGKCVTYTYKYPMFIYKTNNDSLLHPEDLMEHEYSKMKIENMYKNRMA
jgi:GR25 family glycosyltransferase involved in LPS biosynthesis